MYSDDESHCKLGMINILSHYEMLLSLRCIGFSSLHIGCQEDVVDSLKMFCDGLSRCYLDMINNYFQRTGPCPRGLQNYLNISYSCEHDKPNLA